MSQSTLARRDALNPGMGLHALSARSGWIIAFGIALAALGIAAFGSVIAATIVSVYFVGMMMIFAGVAEIVVGFQAKSWSRFFLWMILGFIYAAAGMFALANPLLAAGVLTLLLGASLIATGFLRIVLAFQMKSGSAWAWVAVSGLITAFLGAMILAQWPASSLFILGLFLSVDLVVAGIGWLRLGWALSRHRAHA